MSESVNKVYEGLNCPKCDYDLTGLSRPRCPECGEWFDPVMLRSWLSRRAQPLPFWGERGRIGLLPAFCRTWFAILFTPAAFGRALPPACASRDVVTFTWLARLLAVVILAGTTAYLSYWDEVALMIVPAGLVGSLFCEAVLAALARLLCVSANYGPIRTYRSWWNLMQLGSAFLPWTALSGSLALYVESSPFAGELTVTLTYITVVWGHWWIALGAMLAAKTRGPGRWMLILLGIPLTALLSVVCGVVVGAFYLGGHRHVRVVDRVLDD